MIISDQWRTPDDLYRVLDKGGVYQGIKFDGFEFDIDLCATRDNTKCNDFCEDYLQDVIFSVNSNCVGYFHDEIKDGNLKAAFMNPPYSDPKPFIEKAWEDSKHCKIVCLVKCDPSTQWWATFWDYSREIYVCEMCGHRKPLYLNGDLISEYEDETKKEFHGKYYQLPECTECGFITKYPCTKQYNGPKLGCDYYFFPKRIHFDPPKEMNAWKEGKSWYVKCSCNWISEGLYVGMISDEGEHLSGCHKCNFTRKKKLSGPSFSCALIIMDRRGL